MTAFPVVLRDEASAAFFDAAAEGTLLVRRCVDCSTVHSAEVRTCGECGGTALVGHAASGTGRLVSWVVVHHAPVPALADAVPYLSAVVELDEGPWVIVRLVDLDAPTLDEPVRVQFVRPEGSEALPVFGPLS